MDFQTILWDGGKLNKELFTKCRENDTLVIVSFNVRKTEVETLDTSRVRMMMESISGIGAPARACMLFSLDGFDFDPRELSEIPEAADYIRRVVSEFKHIFYFLHPEVNQHMITALVPHTLLPSVHMFARVQLDIPAADEKFAEISESVTAYGTRIGDEKGAMDTLKEWRKTLNI